MPLDLNQGTGVNLDLQVADYPQLFTPGTLQVVDDSGTLVKLTNVTAPLDRPTTVKITNTRIADVYQTIAKGAVPLNARALNATGQSIFTELTILASSGTAPNIVVSPIQARLELRLPNNGNLSDADIYHVLGLLLSQVVDSGNGVRVTRMMRGVLSPA